MTKTVRWATGLWLLLALSTIPEGTTAQLPSGWTEPFDAVRVADDLYYVGSAGLSAFLFTSSEGHVLIDGPMEENVPMVLSNVRALGFDPGDIRLHLVTHAHFDHAGGLAALKEATGGRLLVSEADAPFLEAGRDFGFESEGYPAAVVDGVVRDGEPVRLGGLELVPLVTPGHTPGCTSWSGTVTVDGEAHSFVLACSLSALGAYRLGGDDPTYEGQADDFCRSLSELRGAEAAIFLSNHGEMFGLAERAARAERGDAAAFVDRDGLRRFLEGAATAIDRARERAGLEGCG